MFSNEVEKGYKNSIMTVGISSEGIKSEGLNRVEEEKS